MTEPGDAVMASMQPSQTDEGTQGTGWTEAQPRRSRQRTETAEALSNPIPMLADFVAGTSRQMKEELLSKITGEMGIDEREVSIAFELEKGGLTLRVKSIDAVKKLFEASGGTDRVRFSLAKSYSPTAPPTLWECNRPILSGWDSCSCLLLAMRARRLLEATR